MWEGSRGVGEWMVEALDPQPGQTILELAAGTGETGFLAAARVGDDGKLISTDFAPKMVDAARAETERLGLTNVELRQLDAEDMDLPDDSVDGVLCRWGYMLMADPELLSGRPDGCSAQAAPSCCQSSPPPSGTPGRAFPGAPSSR